MPIQYTDKAIDGVASTLSVSDGAETDPSIDFRDHPGDGFFHDGTGPAVAVGGVKRVRFGETGLEFVDQPNTTPLGYYAEETVYPQAQNITNTGSYYVVLPPTFSMDVVRVGKLITLTFSEQRGATDGEEGILFVGVNPYPPARELTHLINTSNITFRTGVAVFRTNGDIQMYQENDGAVLDTFTGTVATETVGFTGFSFSYSL
jgi:hypothetical protein